MQASDSEFARHLEPGTPRRKKKYEKKAFSRPQKSSGRTQIFIHSVIENETLKEDASQYSSLTCIDVPDRQTSSSSLSGTESLAQSISLWSIHFPQRPPLVPSRVPPPSHQTLLLSCPFRCLWLLSSSGVVAGARTVPSQPRPGVSRRHLPWRRPPRRVRGGAAPGVCLPSERLCGGACNPSPSIGRSLVPLPPREVLRSAWNWTSQPHGGGCFRPQSPYWPSPPSQGGTRQASGVPPRKPGTGHSCRHCHRQCRSPESARQISSKFSVSRQLPP
mmetsp:Transcript_55277/g.108144  ORF Transcript_55277/g.108144 Transcript_55277/m.108144 type:complete len:275 (+) Transcript_55277:453-1277(+)